MTVDTNSLRYLLRRSHKNCDLQFESRVQSHVASSNPRSSESGIGRKTPPGTGLTRRISAVHIVKHHPNVASDDSRPNDAISDHHIGQTVFIGRAQCTDHKHF